MKSFPTLDKGLSNLYSTPVLYENMGNKKLLESVFQEIMGKIDLQKSAIELQGIEILKQNSPAIQEFKEEIVIKYFDKYLLNVVGRGVKHYKKYYLKSWLVGTSMNYMIPTHNHSGSLVSAVFYIFCEDKDSGGELVLLDPRNNANRGYDENFESLFSPIKILPASGDAILFPSYLYHQTLPFTGNLRLGIPVDFYT
jgi:predicted 2-oxoglutarate/Fe(II)-dependent dioxygenase YbiX